MAIEIREIIAQQQAAAAGDEKRLKGLEVLERLIIYYEETGVLDSSLSEATSLRKVPDADPKQAKVIVVFPITGDREAPLQKVAHQLGRAEDYVAKQVKPYLVAITQEVHQVHPSSIAYFMGDLLGFHPEEIKEVSVFVGRVVHRARGNKERKTKTS